MRRILVFGLIIFASLADAEVTYLGLFLAGQRIGYASTEVRSDKLGGVAMKRIDGKTLIDAGLLGTAMRTVIDSTTWIDPKDRPVRMEFQIDSSGRRQTTLAKFLATTIELAVDNNGAKTKKKLARPTDAPIVDDAVNAIQSDTVAIGAVSKCYVLNPMTATLVENKVQRMEDQTISIQGVQALARVIKVSEPQGTLTVFLTSKGDVLKIDGPMGMEMRPITAAEALKDAPKGDTPDLAFVNAIRPNKPLNDPAAAKSVTLKLSGVDLSRLPSDAFQTVAKSGTAWTVTVHPVAIQATAASHASERQRPTWAKPSMNIPSSDPVFRKLSAKVIGDAKTVSEAAKRVRKYVFSIMKPNAGIGVLRDAGEVLRTKEGVCRDYAVLTTTILRAGHVPARLVSGLVYADGQYFYHAWSEVWDTRNWVGVDATRQAEWVGADHIKLAQGSTEEAFAFTFLDRVKMEVVDVRRN